MKSICALAVQFGAIDPAATRFSVSLKRILTAVGKWHDWQELTQLADRSAGAHADELRKLLEGLTAESLQTALRICREESAGLLEAGHLVTLRP